MDLSEVVQKLTSVLKAGVTEGSKIINEMELTADQIDQVNSILSNLSEEDKKELENLIESGASEEKLKAWWSAIVEDEEIVNVLSTGFKSLSEFTNCFTGATEDIMSIINRISTSLNQSDSNEVSKKDDRLDRIESTLDQILSKLDDISIDIEILRSK